MAKTRESLIPACNVILSSRIEPTDTNEKFKKFGFPRYEINNSVCRKLTPVCSIILITSKLFHYSVTMNIYNIIHCLYKPWSFHHCACALRSSPLHTHCTSIVPELDVCCLIPHDEAPSRGAAACCAQNQYKSLDVSCTCASSPAIQTAHINRNPSCEDHDTSYVHSLH